MCRHEGDQGDLYSNLISQYQRLEDSSVSEHRRDVSVSVVRTARSDSTSIETMMQRQDEQIAERRWWFDFICLTETDFLYDTNDVLWKKRCCACLYLPFRLLFAIIYYLVWMPIYWLIIKPLHLLWKCLRSLCCPQSDTVRPASTSIN